MESPIQHPADAPTLQIKGGPDRDARNVPYAVGNRAARRKTNALVNKAAAEVRVLKQKAR